MNEIIRCFYWQYFYYRTPLKLIIQHPTDGWYSLSGTIACSKMKNFVQLMGVQNG